MSEKLSSGTKNTKHKNNKPKQKEPSKKLEKDKGVHQYSTCHMKSVDQHVKTTFPFSCTPATHVYL